MFCVSLRLLPGRTIASLCGLFCLIAVAGASTTVYGQNGDAPLFSDFKGVRIGMSTEETRKKLGSPKEKGDDQDYFVFNDNETAMVYYDKAKTVTAISIDFANGANQIPSAKDVIGSEGESKSDGSVYKMVRYPKAGYWVAYSRTAGKQPTITVTMQKIDR